MASCNGIWLNLLNLGGLTTIIYFLIVWKQVQHQGAEKFGFCWGLSSWFTASLLPDVSSRDLSLCLHDQIEVETETDLVSFFSYKDPGLTELELTLMTLFNLNYLLKGWFPNEVTLGLRVSTYGFGRNTVQSTAVCKSRGNVLVRYFGILNGLYWSTFSKMLLI